MSRIRTITAAVPALCLLSWVVAGQAQAPAVPAVTGAKGLAFPEHYREWVYLSSGFDMSYRPTAQAAHHLFDNVFVDPDSYGQFLKNGTWPDGTLLVLEVRGALDRGSINRAGSYQDDKIMGVEVHVKDERHFADKWAFFTFDDSRTGKLVPHTAECYSCHAAHAAVDTTFVQFYPTLLSIAKSKGTLARSYLTEEAAASRAGPGQEGQH